MLFSLRLNLPVHRYLGKEGLSSCLDFFMVIMVVDFHGIVIVMPEKCLRTHPTRQLFKPGLRQGREHAGTKSLKCQMLCWSRNTQIKKAPVHNVPSLDLPVHRNVLNLHWILHPCICHGLLPFAVCTPGGSRHALSYSNGWRAIESNTTSTSILRGTFFFSIHSFSLHGNVSRHAKMFKVKIFKALYVIVQKVLRVGSGCQHVGNLVSQTLASTYFSCLRWTYIHCHSLGTKPGCVKLSCQQFPSRQQIVVGYVLKRSGVDFERRGDSCVVAHVANPYLCFTEWVFCSTVLFDCGSDFPSAGFDHKKVPHQWIKSCRPGLLGIQECRWKKR